MKSMKRYITCLFYSLALIIFTACQPTAAVAPTPITSDSSVPLLTVKEATNCRTGPGTEYAIVFTYSAGTKLEIAGRHDSGKFWLVKSAESPTGTCWMWGEYVEVTGNSSTVSAVTPLPTSASASSGTPPDAPTIQKWEYTCDNGTVTFIVIWKDRATDETGYRVVRNGEAIVELPANSTTYMDTLSANENLEYYIQVYGPGGAANSSVMNADC